jgi:hypothetical protein
MKMHSHTKRVAVTGLALLAVGLFAIGVMHAQGAQPNQNERWIHVRVDDASSKGEMVRVNLPLGLAEVLVANVDHDRLHHGHINIGNADLNGVDLRAMLDALRTARDGEFVTVKSHEHDVRVAKENGYLVVNATEWKNGGKNEVQVRVPMSVVDALIVSGSHDLDIVAALRALATHGDTELVSVRDGKQTVRVWLDSKNSAD